VSISSALYEQLFCLEEFCQAFICLQFVLVNFWQKEFGSKAARKMLVKFIAGENVELPKVNLLFCSNLICILLVYDDNVLQRCHMMQHCALLPNALITPTNLSMND